MTSAEHRNAKFKKLLVPIGVGAFTGFIAAMAFLRLTDRGSGLSTSAEIAGLVGLIYIVAGLAVMGGALLPKAGAKLLNVEDADELRELKVQLIYSSIGMAAFGLALLIMALSGPGGWIAPTMGATLTIALIALGMMLSKFMNRHTDELQQALSRDAMALSFVLVGLIGGGWAILAHAQLSPAPAPLDWLTLVAATLLVAAFWESGKRGMLTRGPN
ncbi:MAG: hypothetical protein CL949_03690 [Erythrobacter sp.]|nr:hypothetical protein [Erythrobacter sp.]|tara:strand:+ start:135 stop:782 length:648 start_codon:yes stop_codon:yes gene_type:complete